MWTIYKEITEGIFSGHLNRNFVFFKAFFSAAAAPNLRSSYAFVKFFFLKSFKLSKFPQNCEIPP